MPVSGTGSGPGIVLGGGGTGVGGGGYTSSWSLGWGEPVRKAPPPVSPPPPPAVTPVTPTYDPKLEANALYGKAMALSALGYARIGASPAPIVGPYINAGKVDFIVSFGVPADPEGDRKIYKIYLDNELAWSAASGGTLPAHGTFASEAFDFIFKPGTRTQTVCSLESEKFPGDECAYRPQMLLEIRNLPFQRFLDNTGKPVPYVACDIGDVTGGADPADGITVGQAYERVAWSPWGNYDTTTFESVNVTDVTPGLLLKENFTIVDLGKSLTSAKPNINLLQSDKLRLKDNGANVSPAIVFDRDTIIADSQPVSIVRMEASAQPRELELLKIDPDQDYTIVPSLSKRPRDPVAVSSAVGKDSITLPLIMDAETGQATVVFAHYHKENARKRVSFRSLFYGYEVEPGDPIALRDIADGIDDEVFKVTETSHNGDFTVSIEAEAILRCGVTYAPDGSYLAHYEDGSQTSTYTFTGANIGAAADDRLVVVVVRSMRSLSLGRDIASVTLGGNAMTELVHDVAGDAVGTVNDAVTQGIYALTVTTGTTATIVVNMAGNATGTAIDVYRLVGLGSITPHDTLETSSFAGNPSGTIDIPFNGVLIATYAAGADATPGSATWTGVNTVNVNEAHDPSGWWGSSGSQSGMAAQTGRSVSVTASSTGWESLVAVSFG